MPIRLIIADDHQLMRDGLKALLAADSNVQVVGEASSGSETVEQAEKLAPHVIVMDVAMPDLNGIEATRKIKRLNPNAKILGLSAHADYRFVIEMLKAGASGYLLKHTAYEELSRAIDAIMHGKKYLSPDITGVVVDNRVSPDASSNSAFAVLTEREREVLQLLSEGLATKEIAGQLRVSVKTVETHRRNIMEKLNLHSVAELTKYALREGITSL
ncbi:MAG TPA: DNA-binding response regulator [Verrucomicrobia bacterium]|nr:MAG: DNA-binding response regulator [Lentisphaerae bacterium GWF2_57_35]HBA85148.1 DNA-binding response regulator [Verrucomicrobiota bacterium]